MYFSILIPAYKKAFLQEAIESVLRQTYFDFELVIVNDCSPEDLDRVVELFTDERIRYYKNSFNYGAKDVVDNWNKCLGLARGKYVICMGDDDRLLPDCLMHYYQYIQDYPDLNVYHIRTEVINEEGVVVDLQESRPRYETVYSMLWHRLAKHRIQFIGDFLFNKDFLIQQGGFYKLPYACYSDDISAYLAAQERGIINVNLPGFQYRRTSQTISNTQNLKEVIVSIQSAVEWMKSFLQNVPDSFESCLYRELSLNLMVDHERGMYYYCLSTDMIQNPTKGLLFWWKHRSNYGFSKKTIVLVWLKAIKKRLLR